MAKREQASKQVTQDPWVPAALATPSRKGARKPSETEEWLPASGPESKGHAGSNGRGTGYGGVTMGAARSPRRRRHRLPKRATPRERWLILRLRRSRRRVDEQKEEIEQLRRRLSELEAVVAEHRVAPEEAVEAAPKPKATAKRTSSSARATKRTGSRAAKTPARRTKSANGNGARASHANGNGARTRQANGNGARAKRSNGANGRLDLNAATFDQLRGLGLSITQTSRLISHREAGEGFGSVSELNEIKGLSQTTLTKLRSRVRVGSS